MGRQERNSVNQNLPKMPTNKPFYIEARQFIEKLIRQRRYLNRTRRTRGNYNEISSAVDYLERTLATGYRNDNKLAGFYARHHRKISTIIPSNNSLETQLQKHYAFLARAQKIINNERSRTMQEI